MLESFKIEEADIDLGNGQGKAGFITSDGRTLYVKVNNGFTNKKPLGVLNNQGVRKPPDAFSLGIDDEELWFGPSVLDSGDMFREIGEFKYESDYLRPMYAALVYRLMKQHHISPDQLGHIALRFGLPAQHYQDAALNRKAYQAYQNIFKKNAPALWVKFPGVSGKIRLITRFKGLCPEAISVAQNESPEGCRVIFVADIGLGTCDYVAYDVKTQQVLSVATINNGFTQIYEELAYEQQRLPTEIEYDYLKGKGEDPAILRFLTKVKANMVRCANAYGHHKIKFVLIGGTALFPGKFKNDLRKSFSKPNYLVKFGNEFSNVTSFPSFG